MKAQFTCGDTLVDTRDGKKYPTVLIGSDCWFKQNLNYGTYVPSFTTSAIHSDQFNNSIPEKYAQENNTANLNIYGGLYEGSELLNYTFVSGSQGLCPSGWHVSTDAEWQNLISVAGATMITTSAGKGGNKLKKVGEGMGIGAGTDNVSIGLKHGGDRDGFGIFYGKTLRSIYWTSTIIGLNQAIQYTLWADNDTIQRLQLGLPTTAFSCRCVKDAGSTGLKTNYSEQEVLVYPNPANDYIIVKNRILNSQETLVIIDIYGKIIFETNFTNETRIDTKQWAKGIYFYSIKGKTQPQKIMIN